MSLSVRNPCAFDDTVHLRPGPGRPRCVYARPALAIASVVVVMFAPAAGAQALVRMGTGVVHIAESGVVLHAPEDGLETLDGPTVRLLPDTAEWLGLAFDGPSGHVQAVAAGGRPDWSPQPRTPLRVQGFLEGGNEVVSICRVDSLLVRSTFRIDALGPYLLCNVELENRGGATIRNLVLTREWSTSGDGWSYPGNLDPTPRLAPGICRVATSLAPLAPGARTAVGFGYALAGQGPGTRWGASAAVDVPLSLWTSNHWPNGLVIGGANGLTLGDYDADGWTDLFSIESGWLFRNLGGVDWAPVTNVLPQLPPADRRYAGPFGDYDNDGLPDIFCVPRYGSQDNCHHLLRNLGGGPNFVDVASDPLIMGVQACMADGETVCVGDVDGDGNMDIFMPAYPVGAGNFFWHNLGPTGPGGEYRFEEIAALAGLDNVPGAARPEGAQALDTDFDGDFEIYAGGTLYQNVSGLSLPRFLPMPSSSSGIQFSGVIEEGIVFSDVDLDGDFDMIGCWVDGSIGVRLHLAAGDGTYQLAPQGLIDSSFTGHKLGISSEDWDNDGDMDLTTRQVLRRNQLMETGSLHFTVATHSIEPTHLTSAVPAWGDLDLDGDLDCAIGNWLNEGHYYENTTYDSATAAADRRYVRVRVVRDAPGFPRGLETEYGASVEIRVAGEEHTRRRRKFVSSSGGYLSQNEYTLHFALPADPFPADPEADLEFDVSVDLPGVSSQGFLRVDRHANPVLGGVRLAELTQREIVVYRNGSVKLDGVRFAPKPLPGIAPTPDPFPPIALGTTTGGLVRAMPQQALVPPSPAPGADSFVGIELDTLAATQPVRLTELIVDGTLDQAVSCSSSPVNVLLWDVSTPASPVLVAGGAVELTTLGANDRSYYPLDVLLAPGRSYRLVARVTRLRGTPIPGPVTTGPVRVRGGLAYTDSMPCSGLAADSAAVDPSQVYLACRFQPIALTPFLALGHATAGATGKAKLGGSGAATPSTPLTLHLEGAAPNSTARLVFGRSPDASVAFGGTLVPASEWVLAGLATDAAGALNWSGPWPLQVPVGSELYVQAVVVDASGPSGFALSNALAVTAQP